MQAACSGFPFDRAVSDRLQRFRFKNQLDVIQPEELLILPDDRIFWLGEDADQRFPVECFEDSNQRDAPDHFGNHPKTDQILRRNLVH